jgi:hypothetical protein
MTAALEGGEWSAARPGRTLPPGKTRYPLNSRLGGPQGRSGRADNLVPTGIRSRTVQPAAQSLCRLSYPAQLCCSRIQNTSGMLLIHLLNKEKIFSRDSHILFVTHILTIEPAGRIDEVWHGCFSIICCRNPVILISYCW